MNAEVPIQHIEQNMEATSFPLSVTADWLEDGNETTGNQFQQPDWQVGEIQRNQKWTSDFLLVEIVYVQ